MSPVVILYNQKSCPVLASSKAVKYLLIYSWLYSDGPPYGINCVWIHFSKSPLLIEIARLHTVVSGHPSWAHVESCLPFVEAAQNPAGTGTDNNALNDAAQAINNLARLLDEDAAERTRWRLRMERMERALENLTRQVEENEKRCPCGKEGGREHPIDLMSSDEAMGSADEDVGTSSGGTGSSVRDVEVPDEGTAAVVVHNDRANLPNVAEGSSRGVGRGRGIGRGRGARTQGRMQTSG